MKDSLQGHLDKIRSDAAECLVLSGLATEEKRQMFSSMAEHLNNLALDLEKSIAKARIDSARISKFEIPSREALGAHPNRTMVSGRVLPWLLVVVLLGTLVGALIWSDKLIEKFQFLNQGKPLVASQDNSEQALVKLLISNDQTERKLLSERVAALAARLEAFELDIDNLKKTHSGVSEPSNTGTIGGEEKSPANTNPAPAIDRSVSEVPDRTSVAESLAPFPQTETVGPRGCTQFRSYDINSGTYVTFDGRRRECR